MDRIAGVPDRHMQDALLLKMALERKDFQQARKELDEALGAEQPTTSAEAPPARAAKASQASGIGLSVDILEIQHLEVSLETPDVQFHAEVTQMTRVQLRAGIASGGPPQREDPLLVDLDGDGPETTGERGARDFDLKGAGQRAPTSFATGGDAFLAMDRNGDGHITSGKELFGDQHGAEDGFAELAKFDANRDARIDAADPVFDRLRLFDGQTTRTLADAGIESLALAPIRTVKELAHGDAVLASGSASAQGRTVPVYAMALQTFGGTDRMG